jgi:glutathione S-transferase
MSDRVTFYHNPMSRGPCVHWMLEEANAPYDVKILDFEKREHKTPEFLAVNPMGKIPAIVHRGVVVTETAAILLYLADTFIGAGLAPRSDDPARGPYYRWLFFAVSCLEPALIDRALSRPVPADGYVSYGTYENVLNALETAFAQGPFILGQRFSATDVFLASQLNSGLKTKALEPRPAFTQYVERCTARPAFKRTCG